ncbi:MAG: TIGR04255 family protein [Syntrophomonadaceae bacterium]
MPLDYKYRKPFLDKIVARLDFTEPYKMLIDNLPENIRNKALQYFPNDRSREVVGGSVSFQIGAGGNQDFTNTQTKFMEWRFVDAVENTLIINNTSMIFEIKRYTTFDWFNKIFMDILREIFDCKPDLQAKRLGLRYINIIEVSGKKPTAWEEYLNTQLLGIFKVPSKDQSVARAFHSLVVNCPNDIRLHFQYGMHNPDFPATIRRKVFVLDYDAYHEGVLGDLGYSEEKFVHCHNEIKLLFESSIKQKLRVLMEVIENE